jgi:acyl-CoA thioester hydrolase
MPSHNNGLLSVKVPLDVKTYDVDFGGIVSNIVYIRWLEDLRLAMLDAYFPLEPQLANGFAPVVARTQINYKKPIKLFDKPVGHMWLSNMSTMKVVLTAEISVNGTIVTTAEQVAVFVNLSSGRPIPVPEELAKLYQEHQQ